MTRYIMSILSYTYFWTRKIMNHILKGANELLRNYLNEFIIQLKFKKGDIITITQKEDGEYKLYSFVLLDIYHSIVLQKKKTS